VTDGDTVLNPQHFERDPADIRIGIYPAVKIGIPDHAVEILVLVEVCTI